MSASMYTDISLLMPQRHRNTEGIEPFRKTLVTEGLFFWVELTSG